MKVKKSRIFLASIIIFVLLFSAIPFALSKSVAFAGESREGVVTENTIKEKLSDAHWYVKNVSHKKEGDKSYIVFNSSSSENTRIISYAYGADLRDRGLDKCWYGSVILNISELKGNFYVVFGLNKVNATMSQGICSAISFYDNGANKIAAKIINKNGVEETTLEEISGVFEYNDNLKLDITVKTDGKVYLSVNNVKYLDYDNETACRSVGYFGFAQSAGSGVKITYTDEGLYTSVYDTPENADVDEDFEDGFDANRLYVNNNEMRQGYYKPEGMFCEDGVLKFSNLTSYGFVSTCYEFSNFEMSFDIPHLQRKCVLDDDGNIIVPASNYWFGICLGAPNLDNPHYAITTSVMILFTPIYTAGEPTGLCLQLLDNYKEKYSKYLSDEDNFWLTKNAYDEYGRERTVNMHVVMEDGKLTCEFKWNNKSTYHKILDEFDLHYTPYGYVQIHGQGNDATSISKNDSLAGSSFWIDNLKVKNTDENANKISPDDLVKRSNSIKTDEDYDYVDSWNNRKKTVEAVESGCGSAIDFSGTIITLAVCLSIAAVLVTIRRKKNEK